MCVCVCVPVCPYALVCVCLCVCLCVATAPACVGDCCWVAVLATVSSVAGLLGCFLPSIACVTTQTVGGTKESLHCCVLTRVLCLCLSLSLSVSSSVRVCVPSLCVCALLLLLFVLLLPRLPRWRLENVDTLFVKEHSVRTTDNGEKVESSLAKFRQNGEITVTTVQRRINTLGITLGRSNYFMAKYDNNSWRADQWVCTRCFALTISSRLISRPLFRESIDHPTCRDWLCNHSILSLRTINNARTKGLSKWYGLVGSRLYTSKHVNETVGLSVRSGPIGTPMANVVPSPDRATEATHRFR